MPASAQNLRSALTPCLLCIALFSGGDGSAQVGAQVKAADKPAAYTGLPETGQVDQDKVLISRYGKAAPATATAALPGPQAAQVPPEAAQVPADATPPPAAADFGGGITGVVVEAEGVHGKEAVPVTFGQVFAPGDLKPAENLHGRLADGSTVPLQIDLKAT